MTNIRHRRPPLNAAELPLFAWANARPDRPAPSRRARWVLRRIPMTTRRAELVADLAGLGGAP